MFTIETKLDELVNLERLLRETGNQAPHAIRRAVNWAGDRSRTQVTRALVKQTSAKYGAVRKALRVVRANYGRLEYRIIATGAHIPLRDFGARQTRKGVSAMVWGKRQVFPRLFIAPALGVGFLLGSEKAGCRSPNDGGRRCPSSWSKTPPLRRFSRPCARNCPDASLMRSARLSPVTLRAADPRSPSPPEGGGSTLRPLDRRRVLPTLPARATPRRPEISPAK